MISAVCRRRHVLPMRRESPIQEKKSGLSLELAVEKRDLHERDRHEEEDEDLVYKQATTINKKEARGPLSVSRAVNE